MSCPSPRMAEPGLIEAGLAAVPGWGGGANADEISPLESGGLNQSYRVTTAAGQFVLRISPPLQRTALLGIDRERESRLQASAAAAGLAPMPVAAAADGRWQVRPYVPGPVWTAADLDSPRQRERLMEWLRALHRIPAPPCAPFEPVTRAEAWCAALRSDSRVARASLAGIVDAWHAIDATRRPPCIVHSDLHAGNIVEAASLTVIDWEYAQLSDPLADVGALLASYPQLTPHAGALLEAAGLADRASVAELAAWATIYRAINSLWQSLAWES